jgi:hypothetical protein
VARVDNLLTTELRALPPKPPDKAPPAQKKNYSEAMSNAAARAFAEELRLRGLTTALPAPPGASGASGAERRLAGGLGPKKVDVSCVTEDSGLLLAISVKTINFRDARSNNFQKNLTNRRSDMLFESITLHRRFPYAVLAGFFFLDQEAAHDATAKRRATSENAHSRLELFSGRADPAGRDEQYEQLFIVLVDANPTTPRFATYLVGEPEEPTPLNGAFDHLIELVGKRNADFYEVVEGNLRPV